MESSTIVHQSQAVYDQFQVPPNIQLHCRRVAAIMAFICDHWTGPPLNREHLIACGLLHDIGNIVKFDWEWEGQVALLGEEGQRKDHWQKVQKKVMEHYGRTHDEATEGMLQALNIAPELRTIIHATGYVRLPQMAQTRSWEEKIMIYADLRVTPFGVVSLAERLQEGRARYKQLSAHIATTEGFGKVTDHEPYTMAAQAIEDTIQTALSVPVSTITDTSIQPLLLKLHSEQDNQ